MSGLSRPRLRNQFLAGQSSETIEILQHDWPVWARVKQRPPLSDWKTWLVLGGRGAGKTRTGAEWIKGVALGDPHFPGCSAGRVALVGTSYDDARDVMVEGESGLLSVHRKTDRPVWLSSRRELAWSNGTIGKVFSSADPECLRGSQFGAAWCDELCKWHKPDETWDMLQFCMRLGELPRQVVTTTPKPIAIMKSLLEDPSTITIRSATRENAAYLADGFMRHVESLYGGTRLGRQELEGEIIEPNEFAIWNRDRIESGRVFHPPDLGRVVIAVDPPAGSTRKSASCGIVAAGKAGDGTCYVLADNTIHRATPDQWANAAVSLFHALKADLIVVEANQGGEMVRTVVHTIDPTVPVRPVYASRGKWVRAEPVALLYERQQVRHAGRFPDLEDQMCAFEPDGIAMGISPDRVDALVWAITELAITRRSEPRVRRT